MKCVYCNCYWKNEDEKYASCKADPNWPAPCEEDDNWEEGEEDYGYDN